MCIDIAGFVPQSNPSPFHAGLVWLSRFFWANCNACFGWHRQSIRWDERPISLPCLRPHYHLVLCCAQLCDLHEVDRLNPAEVLKEGPATCKGAPLREAATRDARKTNRFKPFDRPCAHLVFRSIPAPPEFSWDMCGSGRVWVAKFDLINCQHD